MQHLRFEVLTDIVMNVAIFWDTAQESREIYLAPVAHFFFLGRFSTLKIEVICSSETSIHIRTTRQYIPENGIFEWNIITFLKIFVSCLLYEFALQSRNKT
jgi:hypothetical protein